MKPWQLQVNWERVRVATPLTFLEVNNGAPVCNRYAVVWSVYFGIRRKWRPGRGESVFREWGVEFRSLEVPGVDLWQEWVAERGIWIKIVPAYDQTAGHKPVLLPSMAQEIDDAISQSEPDSTIYVQMTDDLSWYAVREWILSGRRRRRRPTDVIGRLYRMTLKSLGIARQPV